MTTIEARDVEPGTVVKSSDGRWLTVRDVHDWEPAALVGLGYECPAGYAGDEDLVKGEPVEVAPPGVAVWTPGEDERRPPLGR